MEIAEQAKLAQKINKMDDQRRKQICAIISRLQMLRAAGQTDDQIEGVIHSLNLPFWAHLFILGNYSLLMGLKIR